jgi:hypothetical protein
MLNGAGGQVCFRIGDPEIAQNALAASTTWPSWSATRTTDPFASDQSRLS